MTTNDNNIMSAAAEVLEKTYLFGAIEKKRLAELIRCRGSVAEYQEGDGISDGAAALGVVISGAVRVCAETATPLRIIGAGGIFGAASVFGGESYLTTITAEKPSAVLRFEAGAVGDMIKSEPEFAYRYAGFLSDRVKYLNRKIEIFTAGTAEKKLAFHLLEAARYDTGDDTGDISDVVTTPMGELASALALGRASLYRALDTLTEAGAIEHSGKVIRVLNRDVLRGLL